MHSEKWSSVSSLQSGGSRFVEDAESAKLSHSCTLESLEEQKLQHQLGSELSENSSFSIEQISATGKLREVDP